MSKKTLCDRAAALTIRFSAPLNQSAPTEAAESTFALLLPGSASGELLQANGAMVEGTIDGFPFRAPLESNDQGDLRLRLSEALQKAIGVEAGETVAVEITRVGEESEVRVPVDLLEALAASPTALKLWAEITPMARREWIRWVASAKQEETRTRRIENGMDMLDKGKRRPCCFPGINWVTKDLVTAEETWIALPSSKK